VYNEGEEVNRSLADEEMVNRAALSSVLGKIGRKYDRIHHTNWRDDAKIELRMTMGELAALRLFGMKFHDA
jgi:hypothetical protein